MNRQDLQVTINTHFSAKGAASSAGYASSDVAEGLLQEQRRPRLWCLRRPYSTNFKCQATEGLAREMIMSLLSHRIKDVLSYRDIPVHEGLRLIDLFLGHLPLERASVS